MTQAGGGLFVKVLDANQRGERVRVKAWLMNRSGEAAVVDRAGMRLRLSDGRLLAPSQVRARHRKPFVVSPGRAKVVKVDFEFEGTPEEVANASLVIGGQNGSPQGECVVIVKPSPGGQVVVEAGGGALSRPQARPVPMPRNDDTDDDDDDTDDAPAPPARPSAPPPEAPEEGGDAWEIGGKSAP